MNAPLGTAVAPTPTPYLRTHPAPTCAIVTDQRLCSTRPARPAFLCALCVGRRRNGFSIWHGVLSQQLICGIQAPPKQMPDIEFNSVDSAQYYADALPSFNWPC